MEDLICLLATVRTLKVLLVSNPTIMVTEYSKYIFNLYHHKYTYNVNWRPTLTKISTLHCN